VRRCYGDVGGQWWTNVHTCLFTGSMHLQAVTMHFILPVYSMQSRRYAGRLFKRLSWDFGYRHPPEVPQKVPSPKSLKPYGAGYSFGLLFILRPQWWASLLLHFLTWRSTIYYLRRRSPAPPFPPDHRQARGRGTGGYNMGGTHQTHPLRRS
jgi:hypothetical protein